MLTEQLNQERVAKGPTGLGEHLNDIYKGIGQETSNTATDPFRFIEYQHGELTSWLMVDTQTSPLKIWYYDYEFGRAADQAIRSQIKDFYWQNYGDPSLPDAEQQAQKERFFNENFKDLARGFNKGEDLLVKRARDNFMTNEAIEPPPVVTKESARSKLFIMATSQSKVSTSTSSLFGTSPMQRRPQLEKEQDKSLESSNPKVNSSINKSI